jgi:hypothetical protein
VPSPGRQVSLVIFGQQGLGHFLGILASHWLEDCANCTPTPEENDKYSTKKNANPLLSLVISRNDKKTANIIKTKQTGINRNKYIFCTMKSSEPLKNLKTSRIPYLSLVLEICPNF